MVVMDAPNGLDSGIYIVSRTHGILLEDKLLMLMPLKLLFLTIPLYLQINRLLFLILIYC